jgi:hypothetical protein
MIRESTLAIEGPLKVSKLLKVPVLIDAEEMEALLQVLEEVQGHLSFYQVQGICKKGEGVFSKEGFSGIYRDYIDVLKGGALPLNRFKAPFSSALSSTSEILYSIPLENDQHIIKATEPIIQLQENQIQYSQEDMTFRSMVYGQETISWGLYFTYPQIFQDPKTHDIYPVDVTFPNTLLFRALQKWIREFTVATPFIVEGKKLNVPIRLGKKCFAWINNHAQLKEKKISVHAISG